MKMWMQFNVTPWTSLSVDAAEANPVVCNLQLISPWLQESCISLFVCLLLKGTSALFRPLVPRIVEKQSSVGQDIVANAKKYADGGPLLNLRNCAKVVRCCHAAWLTVACRWRLKLDPWCKALWVRSGTRHWTTPFVAGGLILDYQVFASWVLSTTKQP